MGLLDCRLHNVKSPHAGARHGTAFLQLSFPSASASTSASLFSLSSFSSVPFSKPPCRPAVAVAVDGG